MTTLNSGVFMLAYELYISFHPTQKDFLFLLTVGLQLETRQLLGVWSTCTAGYASFVTEPEQHSFCANAASALPLIYAAYVSIMQIKLKWDNIPYTPFKITDNLTEFKKMYIKILGSSEMTSCGLVTLLYTNVTKNPVFFFRENVGRRFL